MTEEQIYHELKKIVEPINAHSDQLAAIAKWINKEWQLKEPMKETPPKISLEVIAEFSSNQDRTYGAYPERKWEGFSFFEDLYAEVFKGEDIPKEIMDRFFKYAEE